MLLKEFYDEDIMEHACGDISDLIDKASNGKEAVEAVMRAHQSKQF